MPPTTTVKPDPSDERFVQAELKGRRLGRALTKLGKVTREQVHQALALQQGEKKGKRLGQILVEMGLITASDLQAVKAAGVTIAKLVKMAMSPQEGETIWLLSMGRHLMMGAYITCRW